MFKKHSPDHLLPLDVRKLKPKPTMEAKQCIVIVRHSNPRWVSLLVALSDFISPFQWTRRVSLTSFSST